MVQNNIGQLIYNIIFAIVLIEIFFYCIYPWSYILTYKSWEIKSYYCFILQAPRVQFKFYRKIIFNLTPIFGWSDIYSG